MADTPDEWRAERGGERASGPDGPVTGWLDDRGVSEVIGSILVFGLLVSLLAIVQTQAVPDANAEVEVKHSDDVQGDMANLKAAITRSSAFGGTESTTVQTGMSYPPRLVLYNPPAVQGTLRTGNPVGAEVRGFSYTGDKPNVNLLFASNPTYATHHLTYEADYNRFDDAPTIRYEYGALVSDYDADTTVQAEGDMVNGNRISLTFLDGGLEESQVRPASVTTYPVSAPGETAVVETGSDQGMLRLTTDIKESTWVGEILTDQIDMAALPSDDVTSCDELVDVGPSESTSANTDDGRFIVGCEYISTASGPNELRLMFQQESSYKVQMSKVGFSASADRPSAIILTAADTFSQSEGRTLELRDRFNNLAAGGEVVQAEYTPPGEDGDSDSFGTVGSSAEATYEAGADGQVEIDVPTTSTAYYLSEGPNAFTPGDGTACFQSAACIVDEQLRSSTPPVRLRDAVISGDREVTFTLRNFGDEREITAVKTNYITIRERKEVVESAGLTTTVSDTVGGLIDVVDDDSGDIGLDIGKTTATDTIDGPNAVSELELAADGGTTTEDFDPDGPIGPVENGPAAGVSGLAAVPAGEDVDLKLILSKSIEADMQNEFGDSNAPSDMLEVSVTVTYSDGYRTTYTTQLHAPEDDDR